MNPPLPKRCAVVGCGVIGAGWAARLLFHGVNVRVHDPDPDSAPRLDGVLRSARRAMERLFGERSPQPGSLTRSRTTEAAVDGAGLVVESVPERLELKRAVHRTIDRLAPADAIVTSSTSGIRPSLLQDGLGRPGRLLVAHPFNPVYLLPLVELCGGPATEPATVRRAEEIVRALGMRPLRLRREVDGFLADRLMEALWREALWLVHDGVATTEEVDDAIRYGAGLRWALMGTFQTFSLAGGDGGIRSMLEQFGPCLQWPWTRLTEVPELSPALVERIAEQCDAQAAGAEVRDLERIRDDGLVRILLALEEMGWSAGQTLADHRSRLAERTGGGRTAAASSTAE